MAESLNIVNQAVANFSTDTKDSARSSLSIESFLNLSKKSKYNKQSKFNNMERLIGHFKTYTEGVVVPTGFSYRCVESPKGEFGTTIVADGTNKPYRCKVRTPALHHLQMLESLVKGHYFADLVTLIGSLDIVFGEIDR